MNETDRQHKTNRRGTKVDDKTRDEPVPDMARLKEQVRDQDTAQCGAKSTRGSKAYRQEQRG